MANRLTMDQLGIRVALSEDRAEATDKVRQFRDTSAISPQNHACHNLLSRLYSLLLAPPHRDPQLAVYHANKAIELFSGNPDANVWATSGLASYRAKRWDEALAAFEKCRAVRAKSSFCFRGTFQGIVQIPTRFT